MSLILPTQLGGTLTEREAIADTLHRSTLSWDLGDEDLLRSASTEDMAFEITGGAATRGLAELQPLFERVGSQLDTVHMRKPQPRRRAPLLLLSPPPLHVSRPVCLCFLRPAGALPRHVLRSGTCLGRETSNLLAMADC
jgi:hypothetical protein